ncbi:MAG: hypothetical protein RSB76_00665 [Clostridia bacterium]
MNKKIIYFGAFMATGTLITVLALGIVDDFIYKLTQSSSFNATQKNEENSMIYKSNNIVINENAQNLQFSYNNKYYTYLENSNIYVNNISDEKKNVVLDDELSIVGYELLYDKNMIIYFTEKKGVNSSIITLKTYEIDTDRKSEYNQYTIQGFAGIKDMNMSPVINIIYINMNIKNGVNITNSLYKIDLFKAMTKVTSGKVIDKIIMLQHKDRICYEDNKSNIYLGSNKLNIFKEKVDLIGIDSDDILYFMAKDKVYKVKDTKIIDTILLSDSDVVKTYTNNLGVYIAYKTYIINVAAKDPYNRIGKLSNFVEFEAIKADKMYLRTSNNILITTDVADEM